jgi:hypothetical protein
VSGLRARSDIRSILDAQLVDRAGKWTHSWVAYIGPKEPDTVPVTHDWKLYQGVVAIPPNTKENIIIRQIYGPGTVWFDDLGADYTNDPTTDPLGS